MNNWTKATTNIHAALIGLVSCLDSGRNAWIEIQINGEQAFPIQIKNPALDNPFNWTMLYGVPRSAKELDDYNYFNATQEDLTRNWYCAFSDQDAHDIYVHQGRIVEGLFAGRGVITPVRFKDINEWRAEQGQEPFEYSWVTFWKPLDGIPYWVVDKSIKEVFVICYDDQPVDRKAALRRAGELLLGLAK
jgi:hypothetical protein